MVVLVTGATGSLGSHVAEQLAAEGVRVRALVRRSSDVSFLETLRHVELVQGALENPASLEAAVVGIDAVVHAAGRVRARHLDEFRAVNVEGTRTLLGALLRHGRSVRRFVHVSSLAAVGPSPPSGPVDPDQQAPLSTYGRSKAEAEQVVRKAAAQLPVTILRPAVTYGPRDRASLAVCRAVAHRFLPMIGQGTQRLSIVYAADGARACIRAIEADVPSGSRYFVDDGTVYVWRDMLAEMERLFDRRAWFRCGLPRGLVGAISRGSALVGRATGRAVWLTPDRLAELGAPGWVCDSGDTRRELGWEPELNWSAGVRLTAAWCRAAQWL